MTVKSHQKCALAECISLALYTAACAMIARPMGASAALGTNTYWDVSGKETCSAIIMMTLHDFANSMSDSANACHLHVVIITVLIQL